MRLAVVWREAVRKKYAELILAERERGCAYDSLADFIRHMRVPDRLAESRILVGALDIT